MSLARSKPPGSERDRSLPDERDPQPSLAKPLLASEVLREEIAPIEPARTSIRVWLFAAGLVLVALGAAFRSGIGAPALPASASHVAFSAAGALGALSLLPFPYALRAGLGLLLAVVIMVLGLRGSGPLSGLSLDGTVGRDLARMLSITALPAVLLFRARYRAYPRARGVLLLALLLAAPFLTVETLLLFDGAATPLLRFTALGNVLAILLSLLGFMGSESTGGGVFVAAVVLVVPALGLALKQFTPLASADNGLYLYPASAAALLCVATTASLCLSQLLSALLARDARLTSPVTRALSEHPKLEGSDES